MNCEYFNYTLDNYPIECSRDSLNFPNKLIFILMLVFIIFAIGSLIYIYYLGNKK
jgi:hypothetical protein